MIFPLLQGAPLLVVGAGIMGTGIAQVAAQAGHGVRLFDAHEGAAAAARARLATTFDSLVAKGRLDAGAAQATLARIDAVDTLDAAAGVALVVEAIVEDLAAKRALFRRLEDIVGADCVLATNTSALSVTAIAGGLAHPGRVVGMHFFNPVPLMALVEVVSGLQTDAGVAAAVFDLGRAWGKQTVHARSTPGFIVNRIARPYYAEALALLQEQAATPAVLDACLRAAGFRMGPCELMDLIGHDTNFAVTNAVLRPTSSTSATSPACCSARWWPAACWGARAAGVSTATPTTAAPRCRWRCTRPRPRHAKSRCTAPAPSPTGWNRRRRGHWPPRAGARRACARATGRAWRSTARAWC